MTLTKREPLTNQIALGVCSLQPGSHAVKCRNGMCQPRMLLIRRRQCNLGGARPAAERRNAHVACLCSIPTVRNHASNILTKLMASTRR